MAFTDVGGVRVTWLTTGFNKLMGQLNRVGTGFNKLDNTINRHIGIQNKLVAIDGRMANSVRNLNVRNQRMIDSMSKGTAGTQNLGAATAKTTSIMGTFKNVLSESGGLLLPLGFALFTLGAFMRRLGRLVRNVVDSMIDSFSGLQKQATVVRVVLGDFGEENERMTKNIIDNARQMSRVYGVSQLEVANGFEILAKAGKDWNDIQAMMPALIQFSTIAQLDMESSAQALTAVMADFSLEANEATRAAAVMTQALDASKLAGEDLLETFKFIGPVAAELGFSMIEVAAAMEVISDVGIRGSMAGTTLRMTFNRLALIAGTASGEILTAKKAIQALGLEVVDTDGTMKSLADIFREVERATRDMGDAERAATLSRIFGTRQMAAIITLTKKEGIAALEAYQKDLHAAAFAESFLAAQRQKAIGPIQRQAEELNKLVFTQDQLMQLAVADSELAKQYEAAAFVMRIRTQVQDKLGKSTIKLADLTADSIELDAKLQKELIGLGQSFEDLKPLIVANDDELGELLGTVASVSTLSAKHTQIMATLQERYRILNEEIQRVAGTFAEEVAPALDHFTRAAALMVGIIGDTPGPIKKLTVVGLALTAVFAFFITLLVAVLAPIALFGNSIRKIIKTEIKWGVVLKGVNLELARRNPLLFKATKITFGLGKATLFLAKTFLKIAIVVGVLNVLFDVLGIENEKLRAVVIGLTAVIVLYNTQLKATVLWTKATSISTLRLGVIFGRTGIIVVGLTAVWGLLSTAGSVLVGVLGAIWAALGPIGVALLVLGVIIGLMIKNQDVILDKWAEWKDSIMAVASVVWDLMSALNPMFAMLRFGIGVIDRIRKALRGSGLHWALEGVAEMFKTTMMSAMPFIDAINKISGGVSMAVGAVTGQGGAPSPVPAVAGAAGPTAGGPSISLSILEGADITLGSAGDLTALQGTIEDAGTEIIRRIVDQFEVE